MGCIYIRSRAWCGGIEAYMVHPEFTCAFVQKKPYSSSLRQAQSGPFTGPFPGVHRGLVKSHAELDVTHRTKNARMHIVHFLFLNFTFL